MNNRSSDKVDRLFIDLTKQRVGNTFSVTMMNDAT